MEQDAIHIVIIDWRRNCPEVVAETQQGISCPGWSLSGTESQIANRTIPRELQAWNCQKFCSEKQTNESNRTKAESRNIDSESPSESHPINATKVGALSLFGIALLRCPQYGWKSLFAWNCELVTRNSPLWTNQLPRPGLRAPLGS